MRMREKENSGRLKASAMKREVLLLLRFPLFSCKETTLSVPKIKLFHHGVNSVPPGRKFCSTMVVRNLPHDGTN